MKLSYKKLWVMLVERDMKKTEFAKKAGISSACHDGYSGEDMRGTEV